MDHQGGAQTGYPGGQIIDFHGEASAQQQQHRDHGHHTSPFPGQGHGSGMATAYNPHTEGYRGYAGYPNQGYHGQTQNVAPQAGYPAQPQPHFQPHTPYPLYPSSSPPRFQLPPPPPAPSSSPSVPPLDDSECDDPPPLASLFGKQPTRLPQSNEVEIVDGPAAQGKKPRQSRSKPDDAKKSGKPKPKEDQGESSNKQGVRAHTFNYTTADDTLNISLIREIKPIGAEMWVRLAKVFTERVKEAKATDPNCDHPTEYRDGQSLKSRFDRLVAKGRSGKPRTGNPDRTEDEELELEALKLHMALDEHSGLVQVGRADSVPKAKSDQSDTVRVVKSYQKNGANSGWEKAKEKGKEKDKEKAKEKEKEKEKEDDERKPPRMNLSDTYETFSTVGSHFKPSVVQEREEKRSAQSMHLMQIQQLQSDVRRMQERYDQAKDAHMREVMNLQERVREEKDRANSAAMELRMLQVMQRGRSHSRSRRRRSYSRSPSIRRSRRGDHSRSHSRRRRSRDRHSQSRSYRRRERSPNDARSSSRHARRPRYRSPSPNAHGPEMRPTTPIAVSPSPGTQVFHAIISPSRNADGQPILEISATPAP